MVVLVFYGCKDDVNKYDNYVLNDTVVSEKLDST